MKPEEENRHAISAESPPRNYGHREQTVIPSAVLIGNNLWKGRIFTAAELMAQEFPAVRWAVPKVIPQGVTILAGKPKMGKGWFVLGAGVAISTGGVALGKVPVEQGDCLYLALEDNRRRLQGRLDKLLVGTPPPVHLHIATEWPRFDEGGVRP
jgi:AAA domain